jgi:ABC-type enterochelin transport system permease subunit
MPSLFTLQAIVLVTTAVLHAAGLFLFLQYYFWWYDIMLHFLGGLWVALAFQWYADAQKRLVLIIPTILVVILVGIGWEVFELLIGAPREDNFMFDTSLDILMDAIGGIVGYVSAAYVLARERRR